MNHNNIPKSIESACNAYAVIRFYCQLLHGQHIGVVDDGDVSISVARLVSDIRQDALRTASSRAETLAYDVRHAADQLEDECPELSQAMHRFAAAIQHITRNTVEAWRSKHYPSPDWLRTAEEDVYQRMQVIYEFDGIWL